MADRPLEAKTVGALVAEATTAPSMHNAQPWRFRYLSGERVLLPRSDPDRAMPRSDPDNRALHIGCGAALVDLRVAAAHADLAARTTLLPDSHDPLLLAAVRPADAADPAEGADPARLHPAIRERHTSRYPFAEKDIAEEIRAALRDAAAREGAVLHFPGPWHAETVLDLVRDAESRDVIASDVNEDLARWTRPGAEADTAVDGVPEYAFGPRRREGRTPARDFSGRRPVADRGTTAFEHSTSGPAEHPRERPRRLAWAPARPWNASCWRPHWRTWPPP
ncbi:nitroreductase [Streptomyces phaeoluteigriseus]